MSKIERRSAATPPAIDSLMSLAVAQLIHPTYMDMDVDEEDECSTFLPYDIIVAEILPRLHIKPLFKFKCTSKQYQSIISHPVFARNYMQRAYHTPSQSSSSSGLLPTLLFPFTSLSPYSRHVNTLNSIPQCRGDDDQVFVYSISLPYHENHKILTSSNGLILSLFHPDPDPYNTTCMRLSVSNPLTKQCVMLPRPRYRGEAISSLMCVFGIATRRVQAAPFLMYKIVAIEQDFSFQGPFTNVYIFSSDTGSWATWKAFASGGVTVLPTAGYFAYNGVFHFLDSPTGTILTYDPYDSPDRFNRIPLPNGGFGGHSCLIYSGDEEVLKYCEVDDTDTGTGESCIDRLWVWRLVDSEWFLEGEFSVQAVVYKCKTLMVAPNPWNRDVICHPFLMLNKFTVVNPRTGTRKMVGVFDEQNFDTLLPENFFHERPIYRNPLVPVELCPWSSPCYAQPS